MPLSAEEGEAFCLPAQCKAVPKKIYILTVRAERVEGFSLLRHAQYERQYHLSILFFGDCLTYKVCELDWFALPCRTRESF